MNLSKIFDPDLIKINLKAATKDEAIRQLALVFCGKYPDKNSDEIISAVYERERLGNTSMGRGVAFPHARTDIVTGLYVVLGIFPEGVFADTPDNKPLQLVILLLTPRNISKAYLQSLSGLANFARRPDTLPRLLAAKSPKEVLDIIHNTDINIERDLIVGDVMTSEPPTITPDKTIKEAVNLIFKYKISGLPVVDNSGRLLGEVSESALLKYALPRYEEFLTKRTNQPNIDSLEEILKKSQTVKVGEILVTDPITVSVDTPLTEAASLLLKQNAERLMVVSENKLIGVITKTDIVSKIIRG
jgi:CBS domain-containing protein/mannitol/fructose-specific phosphotransferase system IIA component (Ntr-type)